MVGTRVKKPRWLGGLAGVLGMWPALGLGLELLALPGGQLSCSTAQVRSGEEWWGLYCGATESPQCLLKPVRLQVQGLSIVHDPAVLPELVDSLKGLAGTRQGAGRAPEPLFLVKGLARPLAGVLPTLYQPAYGEPTPAADGSSSDLLLRSPTGLEYRLRASFVRGERNRIVYSLEHAGRSQLLGESVLQGDSQPAQGAQLLRWAGDLDRDGRYDFLFNFSRQVGRELDYRLFLSSQAPEGDLLGPATRFNHWHSPGWGC